MTDIDVGALSEAINDKLDRDGKNADQDNNGDYNVNEVTGK